MRKGYWGYLLVMLTLKIVSKKKKRSRNMLMSKLRSFSICRAYPIVDKTMGEEPKCDGTGDAFVLFELPLSLPA